MPSSLVSCSELECLNRRVKRKWILREVGQPLSTTILPATRPPLKLRVDPEQPELLKLRVDPEQPEPPLNGTAPACHANPDPEQPVRSPRQLTAAIIRTLRDANPDPARMGR